MSAQLNQSLRDLAAQFRAALVAAQAERSQRDEFVTVNGEFGCAWVFHERGIMHDAVNEVRAAARLAALPIEAVVMVEQQACGHVDYTAKYAFCCAELALGCSPIWKPKEASDA